MNHTVEQTQTQVNASAEELKAQAKKLAEEITTAKENIKNVAYAKSNAAFIETFDKDFGAYLSTIETATTEVVEIAEKMIKAAAEQQATSEKTIEI